MRQDVLRELAQRVGCCDGVGEQHVFDAAFGEAMELRDDLAGRADERAVIDELFIGSGAARELTDVPDRRASALERLGAL